MKEIQIGGHILFLEWLAWISSPQERKEIGKEKEIHRNSTAHPPWARAPPQLRGQCATSYTVTYGSVWLLGGVTYTAQRT